MKKKETRGGTRQGSGAKPKYNEETKTVAFRCPLSKVDELRSKFFSTENEILAVTSTNIGTLKEPKIEAHIITADNKIKHLGIIDAQRLVNAANKADKQIALIFNLTKGINEWYSNDELIEQIGCAWIMRGDKVRTILGCCFKNYKVTKIENLV